MAAKRNVPVIINYEMSEKELPRTYTEIVIRIIKYIACQKQIPYPYDYLKFVASKKGSQCEETSASRAKKARLHNKASEAFEALEEIFKHLTAELESCNSGGVEEVMILLGSTPVSPKEIYRIQLPPSICSIKQTSSKYLSCGFIRHLLKSEEFHDLISRPLGPTNVFLFVKKPAGRKSEWLLPKDQYSIPPHSSQAVFSFTHNMPRRMSCSGKCQVSESHCFRIYDDSCENSNTVSDSTCFDVYNDSSDLDTAPNEGKCSVQEPGDNMQWYQAKINFKGFKNC
ncbi:MAD2L1-binding protein [Anabrus simplex]|uniref:MAD2L1-binding protein n=1 Tax=Anabrus simplex TaxID=316456 RepID=UPI0034DD3433